MHDTDAPGDTSTTEQMLVNLSMSDLCVDQVDLPEAAESEPQDSSKNGHDLLTEAPYYVFVLSETGRPIFMSHGMEDQWCGLFALIGVFVTRVEHFDDSLQTISDGTVTVHFSHRSPLILCIVSRNDQQLDIQLSVFFDQIVSTLSKSQLDTVYQKKGDNYDLRRLLKGTDKYMEKCIFTWRADVACVQGAFRVLPMNPTDRDFLSSTMANQLAAAKLEGMTFGFVLAHRQIVTIVRYKKYNIHPRDLHILINLVSGNASLQLTEAQTWSPICLPKFNDTGFFYAYINYPWEACPACLLLLSYKRDSFVAVNEVKKKIVEKLEENTKFFSSFQTTLERPTPFEISKIGKGTEPMWSFTYKNKNTRQICISNAKVPIIALNERRAIRNLTDKVTSYTRSEKVVKCLFIRTENYNALIWITDKFSLQCIFSPLTSPQTATTLVDKLLYSLKTHEQRYFLLHQLSF